MRSRCGERRLSRLRPVLAGLYRHGGGPRPDGPEPERPKDNGGTGTVIIVLLAALAVGAAGWYIKIYKPKHDLTDAEDLDELTGDDEEPTVNEDDLPAPRAYEEPAPRSYEDEPYAPDDPEGYGGDGDV